MNGRRMAISAAALVSDSFLVLSSQPYRALGRSADAQS
jgi:hypothetical protein